MGRADHGVQHKRRREGNDEDDARSDLDSSWHDAHMGVHVSGKDPEDQRFPIEALLIECMLERGDADDDHEIERVILTMNEEGAARDAIQILRGLYPRGDQWWNDCEIVRVTGRGTKRQRQGAELDKSFVI